MFTSCSSFVFMLFLVFRTVRLFVHAFVHLWYRTWICRLSSLLLMMMLLSFIHTLTCMYAHTHRSPVTVFIRAHSHIGFNYAHTYPPPHTQVPSYQLHLCTHIHTEQNTLSCVQGLPWDWSRAREMLPLIPLSPTNKTHSLSIAGHLALGNLKGNDFASLIRETRTLGQSVW